MDYEYLHFADGRVEVVPVTSTMEEEVALIKASGALGLYSCTSDADRWWLTVYPPKVYKVLGCDVPGEVKVARLMVS